MKGSHGGGCPFTAGLGGCPCTAGLGGCPCTAGLGGCPCTARGLFRKLGAGSRGEMAKLSPAQQVDFEACFRLCALVQHLRSVPPRHHWKTQFCTGKLILARERIAIEE